MTPSLQRGFVNNNYQWASYLLTANILNYIKIVPPVSANIAYENSFEMHCTTEKLIWNDLDSVSLILSTNFCSFHFVSVVNRADIRTGQ